MAIEDFLAPDDSTSPMIVAPCPKCGRPRSAPTVDALCAACFALLVNRAGKQVDAPPKPVRVTWHTTITGDEVAAMGQALPEGLAAAVAHGGEELQKQLLTTPEAAVALARESAQNGLLVMVIVQSITRKLNDPQPETPDGTAEVEP